MKLRGIAAIEGFHDFVIRRGGLWVFPQLKVELSSRVRAFEPVRSGIAAVDDLLGGGLALGTTTVIIGPPGTGKSTVGGQ